MWQGGMCGRGVCVAGGYVWQGVGACMAGGVHGRGACMAGGTATAAGSTHPTGMHSSFQLHPLCHQTLPVTFKRNIDLFFSFRQ